MPNQIFVILIPTRAISFHNKLLFLNASIQSKRSITSCYLSFWWISPIEISNVVQLLLTFEIPSVPATGIGTCAPRLGSRTINFNCRPDSIILFYQQNRRRPRHPNKVPSPRAHLRCCCDGGTIARPSHRPCPRLGLIQLPAECKPITARALLYMGLIGPCMFVYARCGKKEVGDQSPQYVIWVVYLPLAFCGAAYRSLWIGDFRHLIYLKNCVSSDILFLWNLQFFLKKHCFIMHHICVCVCQ